MILSSFQLPILGPGATPVGGGGGGGIANILTSLNTVYAFEKYKNVL